MQNKNIVIGVVGLGYVGLPLVKAFGVNYQVIGFDIDKERVLELRDDYDNLLKNREIGVGIQVRVSYTFEIEDLNDCNVYIIAVPTPIDENRTPDLGHLKQACKHIGNLLSKEDIVIFESTVYPGCTEEICVPILEKASSLIYKKDFNCGYSPERINIGDNPHHLVNTLKITSGSTEKSANFIDDLYRTIVKAGTYKVSSIQVAEAAKLTENVQRYINISLINELSFIYSKMGINIDEVLAAASTKWNFHTYHPGLIGGHCISVDPFYLSHKAKEFEIKTELIEASFEVNQKMINFIIQRIKSIIERFPKYYSKYLILGFAFKPNVPDFRNSQIATLYYLLKGEGFQIDIYDPLVDKEKVFSEYGINLVDDVKISDYHIAFKLVSHDIFNDLIHPLLFNFKDLYYT